MIQSELPSRSAEPPLWQPVLLAALAGGLAWGIRGQYGHETGAMLAGLLIGLVLTILFCPHANSLATVRAVAWCTVAMGIGGSMTYGQTVGLTQNAPVIGNVAACRWGMLGLAIKGGIWIGFAGTFFGMGLGGIRYRTCEILLVLLGLLGLSFLGCWLLNEPFQPEKRILPPIYFSGDWYWEPGTVDLKPRREVWGGLLCALVGLITYARWGRRDSLALRLGLWGVLGGAIGFPLGQSLQAFHAWNPEIFRSGIWVKLDPVMNWWNFMETTFGTVMGGTLGLGLWFNRHRISIAREEPSVFIPSVVEILLLTVHLFLLVSTEFKIVPQFAWVYGFGLVLALIPMVATIGGKWWPYLQILPIIAIPIAGKTLRHLTYEEQLTPVLTGWVLYVALPLLVTTVVAIHFARRMNRQAEAHTFLRPCLLLSTWLYFSLNFAFFRLPWPWVTWTNRTPNALIYFACSVALTVLALKFVPHRDKSMRSSDGD